MFKVACARHETSGTRIDDWQRFGSNAETSRRGDLSIQWDFVHDFEPSFIEGGNYLLRKRPFRASIRNIVCQYQHDLKKTSRPRVNQCYFQLVCLASTIDDSPVGFQHLAMMHQPSSGYFIECEPRLVLMDVGKGTVSRRSNTA